MILNQISQSPFNQLALASCLRHMGEGDGIMLHGDGVYALLQGHAQFEALSAIPLLFALDEDVTARNIKPSLTNVKLIDLSQWVAQTLAFSHVQTWK